MAPVADNLRLGCIRTLVLNAICYLLIFFGCYQSALSSEQDLRVDVEMGPVKVIVGDDHTLWLGTEKGLFKWDNVPSEKPEHVGNIGSVQALTLDADKHTLWIGSNEGLFRWHTLSQGTPQQAGGITDPVTKLHISGSRLYIGTGKGLYVWEDVYAGGRPKRFNTVGPVRVLYQDDQQTLWIGSSKGLFRLDNLTGSQPMLLPGVEDVYALYKEGATLIIGTSEGLFRWDNVGNTKITPSNPLTQVIASGIYTLYKDNDTLLISANTLGLFRWDDIHGGGLQLVASNLGFTAGYHREGPILWLGGGLPSAGGLFRWNSGDAKAPQKVTDTTGFVHTFFKSDRTLWIGAQRGLFRIEMPGTTWDAKIHITEGPPPTISDNRGQRIEWQIGNYDGRTTLDLISCRIIVKDESGQEINIGDSIVHGGPLKFYLGPLPTGRYSLYVQATALDGATALSQPINFQVGSSLGAPPWLMWLAGLSAALLIIALSPRLLSLLLQLDLKAVAPVAVNFYLIPLGRWKLYHDYRRWLRDSRGLTEDLKYGVEHYVDLPCEVGGQVDDELKLADLITDLSPSKRIVIYGDGGYGKSTLCHYLARRCVERHDLFGHRLLEPVVINGRSYAGDLLQAVTDVLKDAHVRVNKTIVESQIAAGNLLVILDGLSEIKETFREIALSTDLPEFIRRHPDSPFICTSRSALPPAVQQALNDPLEVKLCAMDDTTERVFLGQYVRGGGREVEALIKEIHARFGDLPRIPLTLKLIAAAYNEMGSALMFQEYAEKVLRRGVAGFELADGLSGAVRNQPLDDVARFFKAANFEILEMNGDGFHVKPKQLTDLAVYGISFVRYFKLLPSIPEMQAFCNESLLTSKNYKSTFHPAFIVCPALEPPLQLQAVVYQNEGLSIVPLTYEWIRDANAKGEQRQELQYVLKAFVGRPDPFHYSNPVIVPGDFYGRSDASTKLIYDLSRGQSAGLFGMRKIGKTSLLQYTLRTRVGPTIYVDCQGITSCRLILKRLPLELRKSLLKLTSFPDEALPKLTVPESVSVDELAEAVRDNLINLYNVYATSTGQESERELITVVLDEVDRLVFHARQSDETSYDYEVLFGLLRDLGEDINPILVCLVAGFSPEITHQDIGLSKSKAGNPAYAFFNAHRLAPMSVAEITAMMNGLGSRVRLSFPAASGARVHDWTGGHPFLARLLGSIIYKDYIRPSDEQATYARDGVFTVRPEWVDTAAQSLLEDVGYRPFIKEILERYRTDSYKAIFLRLTRAKGEGCTRDELLEPIDGSPVVARVAEALDDLEFSYLITNTNGRYRLFARLLTELIQRGYV